jgi:hypothetical protein
VKLEIRCRIAILHLQGDSYAGRLYGARSQHRMLDQHDS